MSLFDHLNYKRAIQELLELRKKFDPAWTYQRLSEAMRVQKSYLSQVLNGDKSDLSSDQLYLLIEHLGLSTEEADYLTLLLEYSRSSLQLRRASLRRKIEAIQNARNKSETHLKVQEVGGAGELDYYLDSYNQLVHVCLSQKAFQKDPLSMAPLLGLQPERLREIMLELQKAGVIRLHDGGVEVLKKNVHLSKDHKVFRAWKVQMRQMALQRSNQNRSDDAYSFSVIFSSNEQVRKDLQKRFFEFIKDAQAQVNQSEAEHVYQMNFDLLSWL